MSERTSYNPAAPPGICQICGCTDPNPCRIGIAGIDLLPCWWVDERRTLCSAPDCLARIPIGTFRFDRKVAKLVFK